MSPERMTIKQDSSPRRRVRQKPYRVTIELEAVMEYMKTLRGMTAHEKFYPGFNSDQLTRFPSTDGREWDPLLPDGIDFQKFLDDAATGNGGKTEGLFDRAALSEISRTQKSDIWVVRTPETAQRLITDPSDFTDSPHLDIWSGNNVVSVPVDETLEALSAQRKSLLIVKRDPDAQLRFDRTPEDGDGPRKLHPPELAAKVIRVIEDDLAKIERRIDVLRDLNTLRFEAAVTHPGWNSKVIEREENMQSQIGGTAKKRKLTINRNLHFPRKKPTVPADIMTQNLATRVSRHLPKFMRVPGQEVSRVSEFSRVQVSWKDLNSGERKSAEVDFIAKGPGNFYVIGEVKLTSQSELSQSQMDLRDHIANGGRVDNPDLPGLRYKTFKPQWREIHIDDGPSRNSFIDLTSKSSPEQIARSPIIRF